MKFIGTSYSLYTKDIHQIWCRSAKFLWKSKFCSGSGLGSGSWFYFGFQYQTYISYIEDTHQILFGSANSFESYCVHIKSPRTYVQPDSRNFFTFSSHTEYVRIESIIIAWMKKKNFSFWKMFVLYVLEDKTSEKKISVCLSVYTYV